MTYYRQVGGVPPKRRIRFRVGTRLVHDTHPLDVVGWDGCLCLHGLDVEDYTPITGKVHQPPPVPSPSSSGLKLATMTASSSNASTPSDASIADGLAAEAPSYAWSWADRGPRG